MINFWKWGLFGFRVSRLIVLNQKKQNFNDFSCPNSKKTRKCWWHPEKSGHNTLSMYKYCYTGLTGDKFKTRYTQHQSDIRTGKNTKSKLAFHVCNLKSKNIQHDISWEIVTRAPQFNHSTRVCRLCLMEAYHIIFTPGGANLNKRDELFGFCKHKEKNLLRKHPT